LSAGGRIVERARLPVAERHEQADVAQLGGKVVGVVGGPDVGLLLRVAPQGVGIFVEVPSVPWMIWVPGVGSPW
jgi:hypothetical protein